MTASDEMSSRITLNPRIMLGKPTIRNMRITIEQILRALAGGISEQELLEDYPELEKEDFQAIYTYLSDLLEQEQVYPIRISA